MNDFFYKVNGIEYPVHIKIKSVRNVYYRFINAEFYVTCSRWTTKAFVIKGLDKFAANLISRGTKEKPIGDDYIYLYGYKVPLKDSGSISFTNGDVIEYNNKEELLKKLTKQYLAYVTKRVIYWSNQMNLPLYKVTVRDMKTRFGSNSSHTKTIHFSTVLMHYSIGCIDSVVIHELAHILVHDHSKKFYDVVYKYCPDYKSYRKKLIKGDYHD